MAFIGWFLLTAARQEEAWVPTRESLAGLTVADVMTARPHLAPGWISVEDFIRDYLLGDRHSSYPVERADGTISGLITLNQLRRVPPLSARRPLWPMPRYRSISARRAAH